MKSKRFKSRRRGFKNPRTFNTSTKHKSRSKKPQLTHYVELQSPITGEWFKDDVFCEAEAHVHCMLMSLIHPESNYRVRKVGHAALTEEGLHSLMSRSTKELAHA